MGEMASLWGYAEHHEEQLVLEQKLLLTTLELEKLKAEAKEEMGKNKEYVKQLIHLLKFAIQERDEARNQLQKLLNSFSNNSSLSESSNSLSFDAVSSPELISNINFVHDTNASNLNNLDSGMLVIDTLVKGRVLPQNGKFLQAVLEAGPLLQTLLVAGPLPRWRNPPRLQTFQIPPVSIRGCDAEVLVQKPASNLASNWGNLASGTSCVGNSGSLIYSGIGSNGNAPLAKRQRLC